MSSAGRLCLMSDMCRHAVSAAAQMLGEITYSAHSLSMPLYRAQWRWTGFTGSPGYTTLHFLDPDPISQAGIDQTAARARTFWTAIKAHLPSSVVVNEPTILEEIESTTGALVAEHTMPAGTPHTGVLAGNFSSAVGACISWNGFGILNGRRMRGRTFLVPLGANAFDPDGTLDDAVRTSIVSAGNALADAGELGDGIDLAVYHRPSAVGAADGVASGVVNCSVNDRGAVLRSRRD